MTGLRATLLALGLACIALGCVTLARADALPSCPPGTRLQMNPTAPGAMHHGGGSCVPLEVEAPVNPNGAGTGTPPVDPSVIPPSAVNPTTPTLPIAVDPSLLVPPAPVAVAPATPPPAASSEGAAPAAAPPAAATTGGMCSVSRGRSEAPVILALTLVVGIVLYARRR